MVEVTRREFLKMCMTFALMAGLAKLTGPHFKVLAKTLEEDPTLMPKIVWVEANDCAGDTISLLDSTVLSDSVLSYALEYVGVGGNVKWWIPPYNCDLLYILKGLGIDLAFHDTVRPEWGEEIEYLGKKIAPIYPATYVEILEKLNDSIIEGSPPPYILVLEGALADEVFYKTKYGGWNAILGPKTITEWFYRLCRGAIMVVTVGTCACYGGMPSDYAPDIGNFTMEGAASHSPSGAMGFFPDPIKNQPGFVKKYLEYAEKGILEQVWQWTPQETKTFKNSLTPYYNFITYRFVDLYRLELTWNSNIKPAIAVPGCPANSNAISITLAALLLIYLKKKLASSKSSLAELLRNLIVYMPLDEYFRPGIVSISLESRTLIRFPLFRFRTHRFLTDRERCLYTYVKVNEIGQVPLLTGCPKFVYFRRHLFKQYPADGTPYCAFRVGCKGPESTCPWNAVGWIIDKKLNDLTKLDVNTSAKAGCTKKGAPCIGCVMPGFSEAYQPFFKPLRHMGGGGMYRMRTPYILRVSP